MMGLRMADGLSLSDLKDEFGEQLVERACALLREPFTRGELEVVAGEKVERLTCTSIGWKRLDSVLGLLVDIMD